MVIHKEMNEKKEMKEKKEKKEMKEKKEKKEKKKPGRKPKSKTENNDNEPKVLKKRGRKPKGGKIINQENTIIKKKLEESKPNIILHLKCNSSNINISNNKIQASIQNIANIKPTEITKTIIEDEMDTNNKVQKNDDKTIENIIYKKIKILNNSIHHNSISKKNSACFWCTYDFNTPPCYIPEKKIKKNIYVYGCFCSPECSSAYLFNQQLDTSTKWERYSLLNSLYTSIYDYKKNIKLAPNPYYLLEKFYGNLTIEEYRKTFSHNKLLMLLDKPLTQIIPEIYEDNNEFNKKIVDNMTRVKTKSIFT